METSSLRFGGGSVSRTRPVLVDGTSVAASSMGSLAVPAVGLNMHPPTDSTSSDRHASLATRNTNLSPITKKCPVAGSYRQTKNYGFAGMPMVFAAPVLPDG